MVFDLDGTLIDSEALVLEAYMAAADRHGVPFTHDQFLSLVGRHRQHSEMKMREYFGAAFPLEAFYATVGEFFGDKAAPLKPGALELFDRLEAVRLPFALATSSGPGWVNKHFAAHNLAERFRGVVTREDAVTVTFRFEAGQSCWRWTEHRIGIDRPEIYLVRGGDWRANTGLIRRHARPEHWVEDMQENLDAVERRLR